MRRRAGLGDRNDQVSQDERRDASAPGTGLRAAPTGPERSCLAVCRKA